MLEPERERRLAELFDAALDLPEGEREAFVRGRCGDDGELAQRLRELLREDLRGTSGVLRGNVIAPPPAQEQRIGPYRLLGLLGEGGMGSVHLAEQDEPVHRTVALKTIRLGGGEEVLARFDAERQALALLTHPNVAKIYDAGTTGSGLPWFAMEYCPGPALDEHCNRERLDLRRRIELFLPVCEAVQHAHLKGVLHRDLKPANVLVTQRDGRPVPKVIDFGLARAVSGRLTPHTRSTEADRPLGTWLYMSPEQADPRGDVDARADVWALGAILYELLVGEPPFLAESVAAIALRLSREDPQAPSRRLMALDPERAREVAEARRTSPQALARSLQGDLDAIALKALERDRARRYSTPSELAADLRRHLADEPVSAALPSTLYRLSKFVRRHSLPVALCAITLVALIGGLGFGWAQAARARDAEAARRAEVQRSLRVALSRSELLRITLLEDPDLSLSGMLERAEPEIGALYAGQPRREAGVRTWLGAAWLDLGEPARARIELERARKLLSGASGVDDLERFLTLDGLIRASRAEGRDVDPALSAECVRLAIRLLGDEVPGLGRALEALFGTARAEGSSEQAVRQRLESVSRLLPDVREDVQTAALVARVLAEAAVALHLAGRVEETSRLALEIEDIARRALDPESTEWLYFLWRSAEAQLRLSPPLPERAAVEATELLQRALERGLDEDHWLVREARRLLAESESAGAGR